MFIINPLASPSAGAPALKYGDVNTETTSPGEVKGLISLDLSNFNTLQVIDMNRMFANCTKLNSLNIINFNTSQVKNIVYMFHNCQKLKSLNLS